MLLTRGTNNYSNDPDGNTLTGSGWTYTWDSQDRLVNCVYGSNTGSYVYGADGFRHRSVVNGTTTDFVLDGQFFVREMQGGATFATYLIGPTGPLYRRDATGETLRWYVYDGLGSVLGEVDASGNLDSTRTYDVYGLDRSVTGTPTSKHAWVGQLGHTTEDETGLIYMRARYMDPVVGRFLSEDPGRNGANWYWYASGNPVNRVDTNGKVDPLVGMLLVTIGLMFITGGLLAVAAGAAALIAAALTTSLNAIVLAAPFPFPADLVVVTAVVALGAAQAAAGAGGVIGGVIAILFGACLAQAGWMMSIGEDPDSYLDAAATYGKRLLPEHI